METARKFTDEELRDGIVRRIFENKFDNVAKDGDRYTVAVQGFKFVCSYSDEEIKGIADLCLELFHILQNISKSGFTRENYDIANAEARKQTMDILRNTKLYRSYATEELENVIVRLGEVTRVGGAHYLVLSKPTFVSAINAAFGYVVDKFDDDTACFSALFLLVRMAMHMNCVEE